MKIALMTQMGKTHLAIALGLLTAEAGHRVYFTTTIEMSRRLSKALAENKLHRELHNLTRPKLLIIDEVGCLQLDQTQASLFFQVISQRYATTAPSFALPIMLSGTGPKSLPATP